MAPNAPQSERLEILGVVAENVLTNFISNVAQTDLDSPVLHTDA